MLHKIILHGDLTQHGAERNLDVRTPAEVVHALSILRPGFADDIRAGAYAIILSGPAGQEVVTGERARLPMSGEDVHIMPVPSGEIQVAVAWTASMLSSYMGVQAALAIATVVVYAGVAYGLSAIANMIMPMPEMSDTGEAPESKPSYYFNGAVNTTKQGNVVPVCYGGPILVGSQVISVAVETEEMDLGTTAAQVAADPGVVFERWVS